MEYDRSEACDGFLLFQNQGESMPGQEKAILDLAKAIQAVTV